MSAVARARFLGPADAAWNGNPRQWTLKRRSAFAGCALDILRLASVYYPRFACACGKNGVA
jgi:hypothetical protein